MSGNVRKESFSWYAVLRPFPFFVTICSVSSSERSRWAIFGVQANCCAYSADVIAGCCRIGLQVGRNKGGGVLALLLRSRSVCLVAPGGRCWSAGTAMPLRLWRLSCRCGWCRGDVYEMKISHFSRNYDFRKCSEIDEWAYYEHYFQQNAHDMSASIPWAL